MPREGWGDGGVGGGSKRSVCLPGRLCSGTWGPPSCACVQPTSLCHIGRRWRKDDGQRQIVTPGFLYNHICAFRECKKSCNVGYILDARDYLMPNSVSTDLQRVCSLPFPRAHAGKLPVEPATGVFYPTLLTHRAFAPTHTPHTHTPHYLHTTHHTPHTTHLLGRTRRPAPCGIRYWWPSTPH